MVLRETQFFVGGLLTIALGLALAAGLYWAGVGWEYFPAWLGVGMSVGFGGFFLWVARDEHRARLAFLEVEGLGGPGGDLRLPPRR